MSPIIALVNKTLLVVDDCPSIRLLISTMLIERRYETLQASNAAEALRVAGENQIDLVILDIDMPDMGGRELLAKLRERGAAGPCVLMSGAGFGELGNASGSDPRTRLVAKPFTTTQLLDAVRAALAA